MRLLRKLFPKSKPAWASVCTAVFIDSHGRRYYSYNDDMDMSIIRKGEIERYRMELRYGTDIEDICTAMQSAIGASDKKGNMSPDIAMVGYLIQELQDRRIMLAIPDILFSMLATTLIREDEQPHIIDGEILKQKCATFKQELQHGGLASFFQQTGLSGLLGFSGISISEFQRLMTGSMHRLQNLKSVVHSFAKRSQHGSMTGLNIT